MRSLRRIASLCVLLSGGIVMLVSGALGRDSTSKLRLMMRHSGLVATGTLLALALLVVGGLYLAEQPTVLRTAYDSTDADDTKFVELFGQQLARDGARIRLKFVPQASPTEAADAIGAGKADLALVRHDMAAAKKGLAIAIVRHNALVLMAPAKGSVAAGPTRGPLARRGKPVASIDDIEGKRIGVIGKQDDYTNLLKTVFKEYGIAAEKVTIVALDPLRLGEALRQNPVDVLAALGPLTSPGMADAVNAATNGDTAPKFLTLDAAEAIGERHLEFEASEIKAGAFEGAPLRPDDTVEAIGYADLIVGRPTLSENTAAEITRRILNGRHEFDAALPHSVKVQAPDVAKDTDLPVHPGTAAYINDNRQTFFDRYGDFIYLGLMLLSGIGSAVAWLLGYARANVRQQRTNVVGHVLKLAHSAKNATSLEQLDALSNEADEILIRTVRRANGDDDASENLQAMDMALEFLRRCIAEKRAALPGQAAARVSRISA